VLPLHQRVIAVYNHTFNQNDEFERSNKIMEDYTEIKEVSLEDGMFNFYAPDFPKLMQRFHVNIFSDYLHSNMPISSTISLKKD